MVTALVGLVVAFKLASVIIAGASITTDLAAYTAAAGRLLHGEPIYTLPIVQGGNPPNYLYPPLIALLFTLLGPYPLAWWIWALFSLACWGGAIAVLLGELRLPLGQRLGERGWPLLIAALLVFPPVSAHLIWGQVGLPILLCLSLSWRDLRRGQEGRAGMLLGLAIAIKLYPALICLPLLIRRRWHAFAAAGGLASILVAGSFAWVGVEQTVFYVREMLPAASDHGVGDPGNYALREFLGGQLGFVLITFVVLTPLALLARRAPLHSSLALGITAVLLLSPVVWAHYFVLALLPWLEALSQASRATLVLLALIFALLASASAVFYVPLALVPLAHLLPTLGVVGLFAVQVGQLWHIVARPQSAESRAN